MITKIEQALIERLKRGLGGLVASVESYTGQFDDPNLDIRRLPVVLTSYGGSKIQPITVGMSSGKRFKNSDTFAVLVITRSYRSGAEGRMGAGGVVGANQLIEAVKYLLINQTLGNLVEPIKPLRVRTLWNNAEVKKEKLSAYSIEFEISYNQVPVLADGLYPEGSDDEENIEYLFKHYRGELSVVPDLTGMREPVRKSLGYDRELAMVANTAFSDRNAEGRIAGKKELHEAVKNAVATSGGTKEEALASINALLASGMDAKTAMNLLPTLQKGAVATGASAEELSAIAISALQNGIAEADIGKALDMAVAAGQAGQFELRDMAKWLPQQMAKASAMGLSGLEGFQTLLVANQQSRVTAGTNDEAGNNLSNLLGKITAKETADRFSKIAYKDEKGKVREINYLKSMEAYKAQGKNSLEAFMAILDKVVGNNDAYKALQEKLKRANGKEEQAKLLAEMAKLIEGSAIAEIVSDQQALMALLGIRNNVQLGKTVNEQVENSQGAVDTSHKVIAETNDFKIDKAKSLAEFGQMEGLQGFNNLLGSASETLTDYMAKYPDLTAAVAGAGTGIAALGAAAFAAAGSISLLGGDKGGLGDLFGSSRGKTPMASGGKLGTALKWGSRAVGVVGVATMLSGDESEETKRLKAQHSTARYAVEKGTANAEQEKLVYEQSKASVDKYDQGGWFTRLMMSESGVAKSRQYMADYEAKQAVKSAPNVANGIAQFTSQIGTLATQQATTKGQVDSVSQVLSQYQADFAAFGQVISDGLQAGLTSQSHTIDNRITVELDGSVIAEKVSQHQFQFFKRG